MKRGDLQPFLSSIATPMRSLQSALPSIATNPAPSPWSPKASPASTPAFPDIDIDAIRDEAIASGRAEGLRETAALREQLGVLVRALDAARAAIQMPTATQIADASVAVVTAWLGSEARSALFAPIVKAWCSAGQATGVAHVHPTEAAELAAAIGELPITVTADPTIARGEIRIQNAGFELAHRWDSRLPELRDAIATALEAAP
ncbi:MAG: hypothetical protein WKG01_38365 [Kofleriaceae bacterium]